MGELYTKALSNKYTTYVTPPPHCTPICSPPTFGWKVLLTLKPLQRVWMHNAALQSFSLQPNPCKLASCHGTVRVSKSSKQNL